MRWKKIVGYEGGYEISDTGLVKSVQANYTGRNSNRVKPERIIAPARIYGYRTVALWKDGKPSMKRVCRLVAEAFCIKPRGTSVVNHIDGVRDNDHYLNLEWTTPAGNSQHGIAKLTIAQVREIRNHPKGTKTNPINMDLAKKYGVSRWTITNIRRTDSDKWKSA